MQKIAGFVTIKMNSIRLPSKNILDLGGHPLCSYILTTLSSVPRLSSVSVFCSTEDIMKYVPENVGLVLRDTALDGNQVKGLELFRSFAKAVEAEYYLLAHTTSPFTTTESINAAIDTIAAGEFDSAFTAQTLQTYGWLNNTPINYDPRDMARTQDIEPIVVETSGIYLFSRSMILDQHRRIGDKPYIIGTDYPECIDIDTLDDFRLAEKFMEQLPPPYNRDLAEKLSIHGGYR